MNIKRKIKPDNIMLLILGLIILAMFFYFGYKMETTNLLKYKDYITGEIFQDITAKKICYIILTILSIYSILIISFLQEKMKEKEIKVENIFLLIVPIFCILLTLAMPMSKGHDETIHGLRIYEYAEGKFISNGEKAYLEQGVINALDDKPKYSDIFNNEKTFDTNTETIEWGYRIATYSPINYLPQVLGIFVSRFFTSNSLIHLYVARLCNIITCVTMLYFAIKLMPFGKNLLLLLSIIPICIEGFSTLSADGMIISASFLWISYIFYLLNMKDKKIGKKEILILTILAIIIALSKTIYIVLLPLLLILPKEKWGGNKKRFIVIGILFLIAAILDIGWYFIGVQNESLISRNNAFSYILSHPFLYLQKILYTIATKLGTYTLEIFGSSLEWNEGVKILVFPYILFVTSIIISIAGKEKINLKVWQKIILAIIILSCIFLVFTSMFLAWSNINVKHIQGVQGRYFMPIVPLIFLLFGGKFLDDEGTTKKIAILALIMQIYVIIKIVLFHI